MPKAYFTTPIFYVNDIPHIGHAYNILATDTLVRYWRKKLGRENVFFLTGTDENSQKTVDAAKKANEAVGPYLDKMAKNWQTTWEKCGIDFDDFIRTTEDRHHQKVHEVLQKIYNAGDIYLGEYVGKYCTGCETFLKEDELNEKGECPDHLKKPDELKEKNYFFRLSKYQDLLLDLYAKNPNFLQPEKRKNEVLSFIKSGLEDISISRESAEIGIKFPFDKSHTIYVWVEALINYISGCPEGETSDFWKNCTHIVGKDITKFHNVIWPAMLLSAKISLPKEVFAHGYFTIDGTKMSKSLGNVVDPLDLSDKFGNDALRTGLLSSFEFGNDGDFSVRNFEEFYRTKLAGGVGNLFNRVIILVHKFLDREKVTVTTNEVDIKKDLEKFNNLLEQKKLKASIDHFFTVVDSANQLLNDTEVWKLAKTDLEKATDIFGQLLNKLVVLAQMAEVILPESAPKMKTMLGDKNRLGKAIILFERIE